MNTRKKILMAACFVLSTFFFPDRALSRVIYHYQSGRWIGVSTAFGDVLSVSLTARGRRMLKFDTNIPVVCRDKITGEVSHYSLVLPRSDWAESLPAFSMTSKGVFRGLLSIHNDSPEGWTHLDVWVRGRLKQRNWVYFTTDYESDLFKCDHETLPVRITHVRGTR